MDRLIYAATFAACLVGLTDRSGLAADPGASLKVGDKAPAIAGWNPDGNALGEKALAQKTVVVAFWKLDAKGVGMPLEPLREVRKLAGDVLILTVCVNRADDSWDAWGKFLLGQGTVNYGDGERRFIDDPRWWNVMDESSDKRMSSSAYGVAACPAYFVLKPDGTLGGVHVPANELKTTVRKLLR